MTYQDQVDRLAAEWKKHGSIIIGVDFDDTIFPFKSASQEFCDENIQLLRDCRNTGAYIMIHTASKASRHDEIKKYCTDKGLSIDSINTNPIELPYGNEGKPYANIYLDDRAGIGQALEILETCLYKQRGYLQQQKLLNSDLD